MNPYSILIVEDEAIVAMDIQDRIAGMGYQLAGRAADGEQALALAEQRRPSLVLMDIRLQGPLDGIAVAEQIRIRLHIPVIFLTAYSEDTTLERAKLAEPFGYILKPFDDRELKSAVEIALYKHKAEEEIRRLNRLYDVLSQVNQAIVRVRTREELLPAACRLVVERGAMDLAWVGWLDPATSQINPVAHFGNRDEILSQPGLFVDDGTEGQGSPARAIREGKPFVCNECGGKDCPYPAEKSPARFGFESCASFPLRFQGQVCGCLNLCVAEPGFFREREIGLLEEVAMDISFALDKIEGEARHAQAETSLRESEQRFRTLFDNAAISILVHDAETGRILQANQKALKSFGYDSMEELAGKDYWASPYSRNDALQMIRKTVADGPQQFEWKSRHRTGRVFWQDILLEAVVLDGKRRVLAVTHDITERKQAEEALRETKNALQTILDTMPIAVIVTDVQGLVTRWNPAAEATFGWTDGECFGKANPIIPPDKRDEARHVREEVIKGVSFVGVETERIRKDGRRIQISFSATALRAASGEVNGMVGIVADITERKRAESELQAAVRQWNNTFDAINDAVSTSMKKERYSAATRP